MYSKYPLPSFFESVKVLNVTCCMLQCCVFGPELYHLSIVIYYLNCHTFR